MVIRFSGIDKSFSTERFLEELAFTNNQIHYTENEWVKLIPFLSSYRITASPHPAALTCSLLLLYSLITNLYYTNNWFSLLLSAPAAEVGTQIIIYSLFYALDISFFGL